MRVRSSLFTPNALRTSARIATAAITLAFLAACTTDKTGPTGVTASPDASGNAVRSTESLASTVWQEKARALVARDKLIPIAGGHAYPFLGVAQYLAVQRADAAIHSRGDDDEAGNSRGNGAATVRRYYADRGAVAGASVIALSYLFPLAADVTTLENMVLAQAAAVPQASRPAFAAGEAIGRAVGAEIVIRAKGDGWTNPFTARPPVGAAYWTSNTDPFTLVGGQLPGVTRWFLRSAKQFRSGPPPAFGSAEFKAALAQVRAFSDLKADDPERIRQVGIAAYWALNPGTSLASGFWLDVASKEIAAHGFSERKATHLYALLSATIADATIGCWDAKMHYWLVRPWKADTKIVPATAVGRPNHPSYPSGHSCVSGSAAEVLSAFFPDKRAALDAMVTEAGMSRVYGGIHYAFDCDAGQLLGRSVARFAIRSDASGNSVLSPDGEHEGRGDQQ
jgi:membrane-associated phospholipid phosphatase